MDESVSKHVERAGQFLSDAQAALVEGRLFTAVDRAYYAMFHAAQAFLLLRGFRPPRTHRGLVHMFALNIERQGLVGKGMTKLLSQALNARQEGTYTVETEFSASEAEEIVANARRFVAAMVAAMGRE